MALLWAGEESGRFPRTQDRIALKPLGQGAPSPPGRRVWVSEGGERSRSGPRGLRFSLRSLHAELQVSVKTIVFAACRSPGSSGAARTHTSDRLRSASAWALTSSPQQAGPGHERRPRARPRPCRGAGAARSRVSEEAQLGTHGGNVCLQGGLGKARSPRSFPGDFSERWPGARWQRVSGGHMQGSSTRSPDHGALLRDAARGTT